MESMLTSYHGWTEWYDDIWERRDRRVDGWFMMSSPFPTIAVCLTYIYLVKVAGPNFMRDRKPMDLRNFMIVYNAVQVVISIYLFVGLFRLWLTYDLRCQPVDYSDGPLATLALHMAYCYYLSKFGEFIDTFCFVARKKFNQVSFLHVIHHSILPMSVWPGMRWVPGGHATFFGFLNTFVHIVMYFYYMMTALGPEYAKYCWWKKHLTTLQMVQFIAIFIHASQLFFRPDCNFPVGFGYWISGHGILFLVLFTNFFIKNYVNKGKSKKVDGPQESQKNGHSAVENRDHSHPYNTRSASKPKVS